MNLANIENLNRYYQRHEVLAVLQMKSDNHQLLYYMNIKNLYRYYQRHEIFVVL